MKTFNCVFNSRFMNFMCVDGRVITVNGRVICTCSIESIL